MKKLEESLEEWLRRLGEVREKETVEDVRMTSSTGGRSDSGTYWEGGVLVTATVTFTGAHGQLHHRDVRVEVGESGTTDLLRELIELGETP